MSRTVAAGALALLIGSSVALTAEAAGADGVLLLPVEHPGLAPSTVEALEEALRAEAKATLDSKLLPAPALELPDLQVAAGCADASAACLGKIGRILRAAHVVRVITQGSAAELRVRVIWVQSKSGRIQEAEATLYDVDPDSAGEFRWHVARAFGRDPGPLTGRIELHTSSKIGSLAGAELFVDDKPVPAGALQRLPVGEHRVEVRKAGFETFIWLGPVRGGRATPVAVHFEPKTTPAVPGPSAIPETPAIADPPPPTLGATPAQPDPPLSTEQAVEPAPQLVYTWVFGASALVAAGAATVLAVQTQKLEDEVTDLRLACKTPEDRDWDHDTCRSGRSRETIQFVVWGVSAALAGGAVAAFFLEDGPSLFDDEPSQAVVWGIAPTPGGVAGSLQVRF